MHRQACPNSGRGLLFSCIAACYATLLSPITWGDNSALTPLGKTCFSEHRLSPNWLIFSELDASFELMLIFTTCLFFWIPPESTSAVSSREGMGQICASGRDSCTSFVKSASHLKPLRYSLQVEGIILSTVILLQKFREIYHIVLCISLFLLSSISGMISC